MPNQRPTAADRRTTRGRSKSGAPPKRAGTQMPTRAVNPENYDRSFQYKRPYHRRRRLRSPLAIGCMVVAILLILGVIAGIVYLMMIP